MVVGHNTPAPTLYGSLLLRPLLLLPLPPYMSR